MSEPITITVRIDISRTRPNLRLCWQEKARRARSARLAARCAWLAAGSPVANGQVTVDLTIRRARMLDADNIVAAVKPVWDGLFNDAITTDDSPRWLSLGDVRQETGRAWRGREEVEVRVRPRETP